MKSQQGKKQKSYICFILCISQQYLTVLSEEVFAVSTGLLDVGGDEADQFDDVGEMVLVAAKQSQTSSILTDCKINSFALRN